MSHLILFEHIIKAFKFIILLHILEGFFSFVLQKLNEMTFLLSLYRATLGNYYLIFNLNTKENFND